MAYAYIQDANRKGKLSKKAEKLCFIGYNLQTKGYRLIDDATSKVIIRRDVIFNESDFKLDSSTVEKVNSGEKEDIRLESETEREHPVEQPEESEQEEVEDDQRRYP